VKKTDLLVDTDILIQYLNIGLYASYLESEEWQVYYSVATKKELLAKRGLTNQERRSILSLLGRYRSIAISQPIASRYSELRQLYSTLEREDAIIAASALVRGLPLLTGNVRHFRIVAGIDLLSP
jgi:predicted nucleic acid-binding protein